MVRQAFNYDSTNGLQIIRNIRRTHPNLKPNEIFGWAKKHSATYRKYVRARAAREKEQGKIDKLTQKGFKMAKNMSRGEVKVVGKSSWGNVIVHKGSFVTVARPTAYKSMISIVEHGNPANKGVANGEGAHNFGRDSGPYRQFGKRVAPRGARGVAKTGRAGG